MKKLLVLVFVVVALALPAFGQSNVRPMYDNTPQGGITTQTVDSGTHGLPVQSIGGGSPTTPAIVYQKVPGTTTYTKTAFALNGSSQTLLAASTTRVGFVVYNASTNANVWIDISGGTVAAEGGVLVGPGGRLSVVGSSTPKTAITVIGTNTQTLMLWEGN